jgi:phosphopantetheine adenylyltransferase
MQPRDAAACLLPQVVQLSSNHQHLTQMPPLLLQEPTLAETDPHIEAIVVSEETLVGAQAINAGRAKRGFKPLHIVVVSLVWPRSASSKLSSTDLRLQEQQEQQAAAQQPA